MHNEAYLERSSNDKIKIHTKCVSHGIMRWISQVDSDNVVVCTACEYARESMVCYKCGAIFGAAQNHALRLFQSIRSINIYIFIM